MEELEITQEGYTVLVYRPENTLERIKQLFEEEQIIGLRVFSYGVRYNLDFLKGCDFIRVLDVRCVGNQFDYQFDFLPYLSNLERLTIIIFSKTLLDLSLSPPIKELILIWRKKKVVGLDKCVNLRDICVWDYKEPDFDQFRTLNKLKRIAIKTGSMKRLDGLEGCHSLETLSLAGCRYLMDISKLAEIPSLKSVHLDSCSQVHDFSVLAKLPNLERLWIEDTRNIESIAFIRDMPQLKEFCIIGNCIITDDDLSPAMNVLAQITPRKSYNMEMLPPDWSQRGGSEYGWWVHPIDLGDD